MDSSAKFQCQHVIAWLKDAQAFHEAQSDYPPEQICLFLQEFLKIFKQMSKLLGIAFSDVKEKVEIMRARRDEYAITGIVSIFGILDKEIERSVIDLNGDNNKKMKYTDKDLQKYVSFGRTLLRMMRFMDYLAIMFTEIHNNRTQSISDACSKAYMQALYPHHTFLVQSAAKLAMKVAPDRKVMLKLFAPDTTSDEEAYQAIQDFLLALEPVKAGLYGFYTLKNLNDLQ